MPPSQPELSLQVKCFTWFHNTFPNLRGTLWAVENERKRSRYEQSIAKARGIVAGVSDLLWIYAGHLYCIEIKTPSGRQSPTQRAFQDAVTAQGATYVLVRSEDEFRQYVREAINKGVDD